LEGSGEDFEGLVSTENKGILLLPDERVAALFDKGRRTGVAQMGFDLEDVATIERKEGIDRRSGIFTGDEIGLDAYFAIGERRIARADRNAIVADRIGWLRRLPARSIQRKAAGRPDENILDDIARKEVVAIEEAGNRGSGWAIIDDIGSGGLRDAP